MRVMQAAAAVVLVLGLVVAALQDRGGSTDLTLPSGPRDVTRTADRDDSPTTTVATTVPPVAAASGEAVDTLAALPEDDGGDPVLQHTEVVEEAPVGVDEGPVDGPAAASPPPPPAPAPAARSAQVSALSDAEATLLRLANERRAASGLAPLASSAHLHDVARRWATHMATTGALAHNPSYPEQILAGEDCAVVAENVAYRMPADAHAMHEQLMASPKHAANILDPRVTHVGTAAVSDASGRMWVVQDFCG